MKTQHLSWCIWHSLYKQSKEESNNTQFNSTSWSCDGIYAVMMTWGTGIPECRRQFLISGSHNSRAIGSGQFSYKSEGWVSQTQEGRVWTGGLTVESKLKEGLRSFLGSRQPELPFGVMEGDRSCRHWLGLPFWKSLKVGMPLNS